MESVVVKLIASRGWHVYGKTVWPSPSFNDVLVAEKETDEKALMHDKHAVAWKRKVKSKLVPDIVGHVPRELSRAVWYFLDLGGKAIGNVFERKYYPSPIPRGGLEIILKVKFSISDDNRRFSERLREIIETYNEPFPEAKEINDITPGEMEEYEEEDKNTVNCDFCIVVDDEEVIEIDSD